MKKFGLIPVLVIFFGILGAGTPARAAMSYGEGYYTNLCGSGTRADKYTCDTGCNPLTGQCGGKNNGAVRYVCVGNWDQCLENENGWTNSVFLGDPGCGNTVQLSLYDKSCRRNDGSWDDNCRLLGYMVWFSGQCRPGVTTFPTKGITVTPAITTKFSSPTTIPTPTVKSTPTITGVPTVKPSPVPTKAVSVCNRACGPSNQCGAGFLCVSGVCRNPSCSGEKTCFCGQVNSASTASGSLNTPDTGVPAWLMILGLALAGLVGTKVYRFGRELWG